MWPPPTATGVVDAVAEPSSPCVSTPQQYASPVAVSAHAKSSPRSIAVYVSVVATATGAADVVAVLVPQQYGAPAVVRAHAAWSPADLAAAFRDLPAFHAAAGAVASDVAGFRATHQDARAAHLVASVRRRA